MILPVRLFLTYRWELALLCGVVGPSKGKPCSERGLSQSGTLPCTPTSMARVFTGGNFIDCLCRYAWWAEGGLVVSWGDDWFRHFIALEVAPSPYKSLLNLLSSNRLELLPRLCFDLTSTSGCTPIALLVLSDLASRLQCFCVDKPGWSCLYTFASEFYLLLFIKGLTVLFGSWDWFVRSLLVLLKALCSLFS